MDRDRLSIRDGKKDCGAARGSGGGRGGGGAAKRKEQELDADPGSTVSALAPNLNASQQGAQRKWQTSPTLSILMAFFLSLLPLIFGLNHEIYC